MGARFLHASSRLSCTMSLLDNGLELPKLSARDIYEQRKKYSNIIMADVSQYTVNHLVTLSLGETEDLRTVEDAVRKLGEMDTQGHLWAQEMLLQVTSSTIKLSDVDSKDEMENYGLVTVLCCETVLVPRRPRSLLLLVFQEPHQPKPHVHFFQCDQIGAEFLREDINSALMDFKSGGNTQRKEVLRTNQEEMRQQQAARSPHPPGPRKVMIAPSAALSLQESLRGAADSSEPSHLTFLRAEQDMELLNRVFDDIESFMAKLQKSAEAFRILNQRRRSPRGQRHQQPGEGLLTLRARPPSLEEFADVLAKMKYSFSLLARLHSDIMNPSSEELVHFLFGPLRTVVEASGGPLFASEIHSPMLTLEAVTLLRGCLRPEELELWHLLGENWTQPRVDFPQGHATTYTPTFWSGWELPSQGPSGQPWEDPVETQHRHEERRAQQSAPSIEANGHRHSGDGKFVSCVYEFVARNSSELSVLQGELLEVLEDSKKWWKVQNRYGQTGYVPYNILAPALGPGFPGAHNYNGVAPANGNSSAGSSSGQGIFRSLKSPPQLAPKAKVPALHQARWDSTEGLAVDPSEKDWLSQLNSVNEELLQCLVNGRSGPAKPLHVPRTPDTSVPLGYDSDPAQVQAWLQAKGFSPQTVSALGVLNGSQLFSLHKNEFKAVSSEEGARVYSQVTVHHAMLEDSRKISELEAVMERQKKKVDSETEVSSL
ncbi:epidermal growth factor receptor kinase substrate 8-like protein 1 isoform X1 [Alligator mississippiensis]|uniref:epidermal growth factor receptor kinase substrate 8-like protein 1 isoform X1 n=1 Tax=Alligator mississippiensis TaxID=8496 RepID=UPI0006ECC090|nr:epidermal growth factor receptor kinase substrate 8-like protein 1 isoform X1 [Alligator mississippiensis]